MSKRKTVCLEGELLKLAGECDPRDARKRSRIEILARVLWTKSLGGDKDALRLLLDRLPQHWERAEPATAQLVEQVGDVTDVIRVLTEAGIIPVQALLPMFAKRTDQDPLQ